MGLELKLSKCEIIVPAGRAATTAKLYELFPRPLLVNAETGADRINWTGNFEFLGAPFGSSTFRAAHTKERVQNSVKT